MVVHMEKEVDIEGGRAHFQISGDEITVISCKVCDSRVKVPDKIENLPVTKLHKKAFLSSKLLKEVWLPKGLKEIGDWAFAYCSALESVWIPKEEFAIGKDIFKDCSALKQICPLGADTDIEKQVGRLLGIVPVRLEADYLFTPAKAGEEKWLQRFDDKLREFLALPDEDGFTKMVYCGEEDIVANVEYYLAERRREKARLCFLRLINDVGLDGEFAGELCAYLAGRTKGCASQAAWEVVFEEHGNEQAYYDIFTKAGCLTEENYDEVLQHMGEDYPEMKGFLMRYKSQNMEQADFFDALSL